MTREQAPSPSLVVCSVLERGAARTTERIASAPAGCSLVELRADHLRPEDVRGIVGRAERPLLVTVRRITDGGAFDGSEEERRRLLEGALEAGAPWIDVEWDSALREMADGAHASRVVLSRHGGPCTPDRLNRLHAELSATRARRLKIVPHARTLVDALAVRGLLESAGGERRLACFAMGRAGAVTRLLAPAWGSWATYGSAPGGGPTAPGQFPALELIDLYRVLRIRSATRVFALIGREVFRSPSPAMHSAAYADAELDACYVPIELDVLEPFAEAVAGLGVSAFAVTMPFKESAAANCSTLDPVASAAGAVNTVVRDGSGWSGFNTDGPAVLQAVGRHVDPAGARISILGAGGTGQAIAASLHAAGARVTLYNRDVSRAERAARALGIRAAGAAAWPGDAVDVLINATPLGRRGEKVLRGAMPPVRLVVDAVYAPRATPLALAAREAGVALVDGMQMLTAQAVLQFAHMTGRSADAAVMANAGRIWLNRRHGEGDRASG